MKAILIKGAIVSATLAAAGVAHALSAGPYESAIGATPVTAPVSRTECTTAPAAAIGATLGAQAGSAIASNVVSTATQTCREVFSSELVGYSIRTNLGRDVFVPLDIAQRLTNSR